MRPGFALRMQILSRVEAAMMAAEVAVWGRLF